jgi:hypothetical protein
LGRRDKHGEHIERNCKKKKKYKKKIRKKERKEKGDDCV